jgi:hypothetical protein
LAAGGTNTGTLDASRFVANTSGFTDSVQRFWYNTSTGTLSYDSNGNASGGTQGTIAVLQNNFALSHLNILLI